MDGGPVVYARGLRRILSTTGYAGVGKMRLAKKNTNSENPGTRVHGAIYVAVTRRSENRPVLSALFPID